MTLFTPTNEKRVEKITEMLNLIWKSAVSNKATSDDVWKLLDPVIQEMEQMLGNKSEQSEPEPEEEPEPKKPRYNPDSEERSGMVIKRAAEQADLKDLTYAMAVYLNRIDEVLKP